MRRLREVGEMRLATIVIQLPSGSGYGATHPFVQMNWKWAEVGPGEGSPWVWMIVSFGGSLTQAIWVAMVHESGPL